MSHARNSDPSTSHSAIPINLAKQAANVLEAYKDGKELLDHEAYRIRGMGVNRIANQRCSDLRHYGFIERTVKGLTPSNKSAYRCRITPKGLDYLNGVRLFPVEPAFTVEDDYNDDPFNGGDHGDGPF